MRHLLLSALVVFSLPSPALCEVWLKAAPEKGNTDDAVFYFDRGMVWANLNEYDKAIADFDEAIRLRPNDPAPYYERAITWGMKGRLDKAISDYDQAIRLKYAYADLCYQGRALCWDGLGEYDKAIADVDHAISLNPKDAYIYYVRGDIRFDKREYDKAIADCEQAIRFFPDDPVIYDQIASASAYELIARIQATCPDPKFRDGKRAIVSAKRACELTDSKDWHNLATLAAAYAESGDFDNAVDTQAKVAALVEKDKSVKAERIAENRSRLELYKQRKPYHEEPKKK